jgi:hypothetical protein
MSTSDLIRWGGLAGVIAGVAYLLTGIINLFAPQSPVFISFSDYLIEILFIVGLVGTLGAIAGLDFLQRERYGRTGAAGSLTAFVGFGLLLVAAVATLLAGGEALDGFFPVGSLAALVGLALLGSATLRARVLPRWCGLVLIAGYPLTVVIDIATGGAGGILLGIVWALVGYALLSNTGASAQQPSRVRRAGG